MSRLIIPVVIILLIGYFIVKCSSDKEMVDNSNTVEKTETKWESVDSKFKDTTLTK